MSEIVEAIRRIVKNQIRPDVLLGQVKNFNDDDWTITVTLNQGSTVEDVTIRSVLNSETTGIFIEPKIDSYVLCSMTDGKIENLKVLLFSEIVNMKLMPEDELQLRGDQYGGLVILDEVKNNLNELKAFVMAMHNALPSAFNALVPVAPAPFVASGAPGAATYSGAMTGQSINFSDMENKKVKHG